MDEHASAVPNLWRHRPFLHYFASRTLSEFSYQIAAVALGGPAVVVSPLLALQREQADALRARGLTAVTVHALSGASPR